MKYDSFRTSDEFRVSSGSERGLTSLLLAS